LSECSGCGQGSRNHGTRKGSVSGRDEVDMLVPSGRSHPFSESRWIRRGTGATWRLYLRKRNGTAGRGQIDSERNVDELFKHFWNEFCTWISKNYLEHVKRSEASSKEVWTQISHYIRLVIAELQAYPKLHDVLCKRIGLPMSFWQQSSKVTPSWPWSYSSM
jgi:hypothetical protein